MSLAITEQKNHAAEEITEAEGIRTGDWYRPPVDITEGFEEIRIVASMPGVLHEDIAVSFERGVLKISARVRSRQEQEPEYLLREFAPSGYERTFRIGESIDVESIAAEYADGVLTLHLPKADSARPRTIPVMSP